MKTLITMKQCKKALALTALTLTPALALTSSAQAAPTFRAPVSSHRSAAPAGNHNARNEAPRFDNRSNQTGHAPAPHFDSRPSPAPHFDSRPSQAPVNNSHNPGPSRFDTRSNDDRFDSRYDNDRGRTNDRGRGNGQGRDNDKSNNTGKIIGAGIIGAILGAVLSH